MSGQILRCSDVSLIRRGAAVKLLCNSETLRSDEQE
jgi:hypothetical protein